MRSIRMIVKNFERPTRNQTPSIGSPAPRTGTLPAGGGSGGWGSTEPRRAGGASWNSGKRLRCPTTDPRLSDTVTIMRILMRHDCVAQDTAVANCGKSHHSPFNARNAQARWDPA